MKIEKKDGKMYVQCDYNKTFIREAKMIQGKWNAPCWVFPEENEAFVRKILMDVYGEDGTPQALVTVDLNLDEYCQYSDDDIRLGEIVIAKRWERDSAVKLAANAMVTSGKFFSSGGSRNHPSVSFEEGTVLRVKDIPEALYQQIKSRTGVSLVEDDGKEQKIAKLNAERESLLKRLAEIEAELGSLQ